MCADAFEPSLIRSRSERREQLVLLLSDVCPQQRKQLLHELLELRVARSQPLHGLHQLVDVLVLAFDVACQRVSIGEQPTRHREQHGLFRKGVCGHERLDVRVRRLLTLSRPPLVALE